MAAVEAYQRLLHTKREGLCAGLCTGDRTTAPTHTLTEREHREDGLKWSVVLHSMRVAQDNAFAAQRPTHSLTHSLFKAHQRHNCRLCALIDTSVWLLFLHVLSCHPPISTPDSDFPLIKASSFKRVQVLLKMSKIRWCWLKKLQKIVTLRLPSALSLSR